MQPTTHEILQTIWAQSEGETVFLPTSLGDDQWVEGDGLPPEKWDETNLYFKIQNDDSDYYFTPLKYYGPQRRKAFVGNPGVIYADLDGNQVEEPRLKPSIIIATSLGHYHAYWFLNKPVSPVEWEPRAKAWSQEIGADPAGWDLTQVLRVPNTYNNKHHKGNMVVLQSWHPELTYDLSEFPTTNIRSYPVPQEAPPANRQQALQLIAEGIAKDKIPLTARYWLTITDEQLAIVGKIDRSAIMWQIEKQLISEGYTFEEVYQMMNVSRINKWRQNPLKLWQEIHKAGAPK